MNLPAPRDTLFGCMWLPRIRAKAQQYKTGKLPEIYARPFCIPPAVDGQFLAHFQLDKDAILDACDLPDADFEAWFRALPNNSDAHIAKWNEIAVNLGRPGYPMAERLPWAISEYYQHIAHLNPQTVFATLEADEGIAHS
ncbi:DUF5069 domain-containing protein [Cerasicoccus arenae]|nr:DUF5069 domain-containing protein [Cerasicoccus arenae]MBK1857266.1 DUF5069 domain-containing protein [Cerasicoccus arenae]